MSKEKSFLDQIAEKLTERSDRITKGRVGSDSVCLMKYSTDEEIVGTNPQATPPEANGDFLSDGDLYFDRFPEPADDPIALRMERGAKWTDVLAASCTYHTFLVNSRALQVFKQFDLGNVRFYGAEVTGKGDEKRDYTYIFFCNHATLEDVDLSRSECHLVDMIGQPIREIEIADAEDFKRKDKLARRGVLPDSERFSRIEFGKIQLLSGHAPTADLFGMHCIDTRVYASTALRDALQEAGITGLEFKRNTRLFF